MVPLISLAVHLPEYVVTICRPSRSRTTLKWIWSPSRTAFVIRVRVVGRKLMVPLSLPLLTSRTSLGREVPPSGMVKLHRHEPSSGWVGGVDVSSAANRQVGLRSRRKMEARVLRGAFI